MGPSQRRQNAIGSLDESATFYRRLGFEATASYDGYLVLVLATSRSTSPVGRITTPLARPAWPISESASGVSVAFWEELRRRQEPGIDPSGNALRVGHLIDAG